MMTPSLMPVLSRVCKSGSRSDGAARAARVALAGAGYFSVWVILGALIYPLGAGLAMGAMRSAGFANAIPAWAGAAILLADLVPLSAWKCCKLAHCRNAARSIDLPLKAPGMWKIGARLGIECVSCCLPFMTVLLVAGVMNLGIMAAVATGITVERLLPVPEIVARASGVLMVLAGGLLAGGVLTL